MSKRYQPCVVPGVARKIKCEICAGLIERHTALGRNYANALGALWEAQQVNPEGGHDPLLANVDSARSAFKAAEAELKAHRRGH